MKIDKINLLVTINDKPIEGFTDSLKEAFDLLKKIDDIVNQYWILRLILKGKIKNEL
jgi:hypothetical protein